MVTRLSMFVTVCLLLSLLVCSVQSSSNKKPHGHQGVLEPFDGKPISVSLTDDQLKKVESGAPVMFTDRVGKSGRGVVIQDVHADEDVCMEKILDFRSYPKYVSSVKNVNIYHTLQFPNGTAQTGAEFNVGVLGLRFGYYMLLTHEPKWKTLTWTLDYKYNSDFDDTVGHWQVMAHPSKSGWSRVLYSTKVKLFSWVPEMVVNFLTSKALIESTAWVKKESEAEYQRRQIANLQKQQQESSSKQPPNPSRKWFFQGGYIDTKHQSRDVQPTTMSAKWKSKFQSFVSKVRYTKGF